jgi:hypothetical protein
VDWGAYEVFSVISGVVLVVGALLPGVRAKDRVWLFLGGVFFIAYGIYVASRTSGTWVFPVWIFVIPFGGVAYFIYRLVEFAREKQQSPTDAQPERVWLQPAAPVVSRFCSQCGTRAEVDAGFCGGCGARLETLG